MRRYAGPPARRQAWKTRRIDEAVAGAREVANVQAELVVGNHSQGAAADPEEAPRNAAAAYEPHGEEDNTQAGVGTESTGAQAHALQTQVREVQTHTTGAEARTHMTGVAGDTHWTKQRPIELRLAAPCQNHISWKYAYVRAPRGGTDADARSRPRPLG